VIYDEAMMCHYNAVVYNTSGMMGEFFYTDVRTPAMRFNNLKFLNAREVLTEQTQAPTFTEKCNMKPDALTLSERALVTFSLWKPSLVAAEGSQEAIKAKFVPVF
jgi:hypothetical protein